MIHHYAICSWWPKWKNAVWALPSCTSAAPIARAATHGARGWGQWGKAAWPNSMPDGWGQLLWPHVSLPLPSLGWRSTGAACLPSITQLGKAKGKQVGGRVSRQAGSWICSAPLACSPAKLASGGWGWDMPHPHLTTAACHPSHWGESVGGWVCLDTPLCLALSCSLQGLSNWVPPMLTPALFLGLQKQRVKAELPPIICSQHLALWYIAFGYGGSIS